MHGSWAKIRALTLILPKERGRSSAAGVQRGDGGAGQSEKAVAQATVRVRGTDQRLSGGLVLVEVRADEPGNPPSVVPRGIDRRKVQRPSPGRTAVARKSSG